MIEIILTETPTILDASKRSQNILLQPHLSLSLLPMCSKRSISYILRTNSSFSCLSLHGFLGLASSVLLFHLQMPFFKFHLLSETFFTLPFLSRSNPPLQESPHGSFYPASRFSVWLHTFIMSFTRKLSTITVFCVPSSRHNAPPPPKAKEIPQRYLQN